MDDSEANDAKPMTMYDGRRPNDGEANDNEVNFGEANNGTR